MGGRGSGDTKEKAAARKFREVAAKDATTATNRYYQQLLQAKGDIFFEIWKCYPSGKKACLGTTEDIRNDQLGVMFGGGEYDIVPLKRTDSMPTGQPALRRILHPGKYPVRAEYDMDPAEAEMMQVRERRNQSQGSDSDMASMSPEQIYEKAKNDALKEFTAKSQMDQLTAAVASLTNKIEVMQSGGGMQAGGNSNLANLREMFTMFKELTPAVAPANPNIVSSPADAIRQSIEAIKLFQTEMSGLPGNNPVEQALKNSAKDSNVSVLANTLSTIAAAAIPHLLQTFAPAPAGAAAPAAATAPVAVAAPPAPAGVGAAASDQQVAAMMKELHDKLLADQALQLQEPPQGHIQQTVDWLKARWSDATADDAWKNMRTAALNYPEAQVVSFMAVQIPQLADTDKKKAWLASLVEMVRRP